MLRPFIRSARDLHVPAPLRRLSSLSAAVQSWNGRLVLSEQVKHALEKGQPIVALESTIITHGMPQPVNLSTAKSLEQILRDQQVTPATVALLDGKVHVGLDDAQLQRLADLSSNEVKVKVSRRDIAPALARGIVGGTTVAGTMYVASSVGIPLFVTGGIGGVHRGAENSMDVSADLIELGRTPMGVICAGAKSILDIPRTLEVLETQGVCVATYGESLDFPAFYTASSGQKSSWTVSDPTKAAAMIHAGLDLPSPLSTLLAVPIPAEYEAQGNTVQEAVEQAVRESVEQGIDKRGKEVTPWLLKRVGELTGGTALKLNVALIENNARVGASVARELTRLRNGPNERSHSSHASSVIYSSPTMPGTSTTPSRSYATFIRVSPSAPLPPPKIIVIGSAALDITSSTSQALSPRSTTPGEICFTPGGVGRNIAEAAQKLLPPGSVKLISGIGAGIETPDTPDAVGCMIMREMEVAGMRTDGLVLVPGSRSAGCTLILDGQGDLEVGVADMDVVTKLSPEEIRRAIMDDCPAFVVCDCNLDESVLKMALTAAREDMTETFCDPTSVPKLHKLLAVLKTFTADESDCFSPLRHLAPNLIELDALYASLQSGEWKSVENDRYELYSKEHRGTLDLHLNAELDRYLSAPHRQWMREGRVLEKALFCLHVVDSLWIKAGSKGLIRVSAEWDRVADGRLGKNELVWQPRDSQSLLTISYYPADVVPAAEIVNTTGAGDTLVGGLVGGMVKGGEGEEDWVRWAMEGVGRTLRSRRAVG